MSFGVESAPHLSREELRSSERREQGGRRQGEVQRLVELDQPGRFRHGCAGSDRRDHRHFGEFRRVDTHAGTGSDGGDLRQQERRRRGSAHSGRREVGTRGRYRLASRRFVWSRRCTSTRTDALLNAAWTASVAVRNACALISMALICPTAATVVVRGSARPVKYSRSPKQSPGLRVFKALPWSVTLASPSTRR